MPPETGIPLTNRSRAASLPHLRMVGITYTLVLASLLAGTPDRPDISALAPAHQQTFAQVAAEEFCGCKSSLSLAGCLDFKKDCKIANHLADLVVQRVESGNNSDEILGFLADRVLGPFCAKERALDFSALPFKGNAEAPITVVEFADFRCPHCKAEAPAVLATAKRFGKKVKFHFVPFPLRDHPQSVAAAEALFAAGAQGKYWAMHDELFAHQESGFDSATLLKIAKKLRLNMKRFKNALDKHQYKDQIAQLKQQALKVGVIGTPSFFIDGRLFSPDSKVMTLARRLEMELDRNIGTCQ